MATCLIDKTTSDYRAHHQTHHPFVQYVLYGQPLAGPTMEATREWYGAIDQGTTSTRFIIFDLAKNPPQEIIKASRHAHTDAPHPGWAQQDPLLMLGALKECIEEVETKIKQKYGYSSLKQCIKSIGITNQRETTIAWDAGTVWLDTRTKDLLGKIPYNLEHEARTGLPLSTYFSGPKILWMLQNIPAVQPSNPNLRFGTVDSWLMMKLLEGRPHVTDCTNACRTLCYDMHEFKWDDELCGLFQIRKEWLAPRVLINTGEFGAFSGESSAKGIKLTASLGDQHASLIGHGCYDHNCAKLTLGTGCFLLRTLADNEMAKTKFDGLIKTIGHHLVAGKSPVYAVEASVSAGGNMISWLVEHLEILRDKRQIDEIVKLPGPSDPVDDCVYFLPALAGLLAPYWKPDAKASFHGLSLNSGRLEMILSVVESIAFACCQVIALSKQTDPTRIKLDGGLTKCSALMTILASTLNSAVCIAEESDSTALGAAIAARVGDTGTLPISTTAPLRFVTPRPDLVGHYSAKYQHWLKLMNHTFS